MSPDPLAEALNRLVSGSTFPEDLRELQEALNSGRITFASNDSVAIGGDVSGSIVAGSIIVLPPEVLKFLPQPAYQMLNNLNIKRDILEKEEAELSDKMSGLVGPLYNARRDDIIFTRVNVFAVRNKKIFEKNPRFWDGIGLNAHKGSVSLKTALREYLNARNEFLSNHSDQSPESLTKNRRAFDSAERILLSEIEREYTSTSDDINSTKDKLKKVKEELINSI